MVHSPEEIFEDISGVSPVVLTLTPVVLCISYEIHGEKDMSSMLHIRLDDDLKAKGNEALAEMGLTAAEAVRLLYPYRS